MSNDISKYYEENYEISPEERKYWEGYDIQSLLNSGKSCEEAMKIITLRVSKLAGRKVTVYPI